MDDKCGSRLSAILQRVITTEINLRAADLTTAEQNINTVREYLNKTRLGVCADFYDDNFKTTLQKPAHRAVKKTFAGKTPIKQEPTDVDMDNHCRPSSQSKRSIVDFENCNTIKEEEHSDLDNGCLKQENFDDEEDPQPKYLDPNEKVGVVSGVEKKRPRYIPPTIPVDQIQHSLKPRGNKTTRKVRFLVRNNSKYILTPEDSSGATHKWSLNVKLSDDSLDISQIVSKVVFYLHPTYKPHDVVTVTSAPFKITRRGWGEFDLCIKIFFKDEKNEPIAVTHPLVFDKLHSGMETFGGETIFDHWIIEPSEPTSASYKDVTPSSKGNELNLSDAKSLPTLSSATFDDFSTIPFNNETSKHFLSAIFGEPEELSAAKKDWEQFDSLFNLDDLAFPEFFGSCTNEPKSSTLGKSGNSQVSPPEKKPTPGNERSTDEKSTLKQAISTVTSKLKNDGMIHSRDEGPTHLDSSDLVSGATCDTGESLTSKPVSTLSSETISTGRDSPKENHDCNESGAEKELYLSDLSEFGDEIIIMDSCDGTVVQSDVKPGAAVDETLIKSKTPPECVDYSSVEMDDLIKFPSEKLSFMAQSQKITTKCGSGPVIAAGKVSTVSPKKARRSTGTMKASPQSGLKTGIHLVPKHCSPTLVTANLTPTMSKKGTNCPSATMLVSSTNPPSIVNNKSTVSHPPKTLLVSSSHLSTVISPKSLVTSTTAQQKPSTKNGNRTVVKKVAAPIQRNASKVASIGTIGRGSIVSLPSTSRAQLQGSLAVPLEGAVTSGYPVPRTTSGQPLTLLSVISPAGANIPVSKTAPVIISSPNVPATKTTPIVISSPKVRNQATPTLLVPSSMILKQALNKVGGQLNKTILPQVISLAPKGNKLMNNITSTSTTQIRPGGTRFLVKMPDGTLKPINLESLTPLKPSELKRVNPTAAGPSSQVLVSQPVLLRPPVSKSVPPAATQPSALVGIASRGKRAAPANTITAKRRKTEPKLIASCGNIRTQRTPIILSGAPQVLFKLPQSPNQLLVVPQAANPPVIRLPNQRGKNRLSNPSPISNEKATGSTKTVTELRKPAADPEHPSTLIPRPEGMSILKRRPSETEVDARSLIEQCPRYSTEVSICWLLKKFPLVHSRAGEESFKQVFPYCAVCVTQFNRWPLAKRRAHELLRANDVMRVVGQMYLTCDWKKIDIVKFARLRGFTPIVGKISPAVHVHQLPTVEDRCSLAETDELSGILASYKEVTEDIDVTSCGKVDLRCNLQPTIQTKEIKTKTFMTLQGHLEDAQVVEKWVERISIYPEPEEIEPGVFFPAALRALVSAFRSFAEDLTRRSYSSSYLRHNSTEPHNVTPEDVQLALISREEFDIFSKQGFGTRCTKGSTTQLEIKELPDTKS